MPVNRTFLHYCRMLHTYMTMLGMFVMLLFAVTGILINHEGFFGATTPHVTESEGTTPKSLLDAGDALRVVEHLRSTFRVSGAMSEYADLDDHVAVGFKSPDHVWEIEIDKADGATRVHEETSNFVALVNNLHRGRYTGTAWAWVIDVSAGLIVFACATGFVLWLVLPKRRMLGVIGLVGGFVVPLLVYVWLVPGKDAAPKTRATAANPTSAES